MARTEATLPGGARLADYLAVGYLVNIPRQSEQEFHGKKNTNSTAK